MLTNKTIKKLLKASEAACRTDTQHIILSVSAEGRVHANTHELACSSSALLPPLC